MRVLALVPYPTLGASNRLRVEQYIPLLRTSGIEVDVSPYFSADAYRILYVEGNVPRKALHVAAGAARRVRDLVAARRYDLLFIHRESAPIGPPLVERALALMHIPFVFDFDDAIFLPAISPVNRSWGWLRRTDAAESARQASLVIAGNEYLASWARERNPRVVVIPTPVDTDRHTPRVAAPAEGPLVVGWVGSPSTARYLRLLDRVVDRLARRHAFLIRVVGGTYEHASVPVECLPYSLADEPGHVRAFDIGVLPEPDDPWTRGKGGFKALVYMASGVPVVASRVGVNEEVVGPGGFCVGDDAAWEAALDRLLSDEGLRRSVGAAGRSHVLARYSLSVQAPRLAAALRSALSGRGVSSDAAQIRHNAGR